MNIIDNNISYVIPLEDIDLKYCYNYAKDRVNNDLMPLWNNKNNNYCELKIFAQRKRQLSQNEITGADDQFTENTKYKCHVCNLSVPVAYKKEHIHGAKHKTCLMIMDAAMVRARKYLIQDQNDKQHLKPAQHSYYCEPCAAEVKIINRKDHDMSKEHFKSLMHSKFLDDLLKIYIDKEHLEKVDFEYMTNDSTSAVNENYQQHDSDSGIAYKELNENDEINRFLNLMQSLNNDDDLPQHHYDESTNKKPLSLSDKVVNTSDKTLKSKTKQENVNLKKYIKMLLRNNNSQLSHKIKVSGNRVVIEAADKSVLTVSEDSFHSFTRDMDGKTNFCKLCALPFIDENSHKMTLEHMSRIMAPIQDMHGIRQGRNNTTAHCILCNSNLITKEGHVASVSHLDSLKALYAVTKESDQKTFAQPSPTKIKTGMTYCKTCNRLIHTHNYEAHIRGASHKNNVTVEINHKNKETSTSTNAVNVTEPSKTYCALCNIYVDTHNLNSHLFGKKHKTNVELSKSAKTEKTLEPKPSTSKDGQDTASKKYCDVCEIFINRIQFASHVNGGPHKQKLLKNCGGVAVVNTSYLKINNNRVICEICKVEFDANLSKLHVDSASHDETLTLTLKKNKIEKEPDFLYCTLCTENISNNDLVEHISIYTHKKLLAISNNQYYCKICDLYVPDTHYNIDGHINGKRHKQNCID